MPMASVIRPATSGRGFALVELLVALAITGILFAAVYQVFIGQQRIQIVQDELSDAQQNARIAVADLTRALTSLGSGVDVDNGQVRILMAHEFELVFNGDLSTDAAKRALPCGAPMGLPSLTASDPYQTVPGNCAALAAQPPAEAYRFYLKQDDTQYILYRQMGSQTGWGQPQQVALLVANPFLDQSGTPEPLFQYEGDFDGDGSDESLPRVDNGTSSRLAAGASLDHLIRRVRISLVTRTAHPDSRHAQNDGYRLARVTTAVSPRNLWDCPVITPVTAASQLRAPDLLGQAYPVQFRVTRGGAAESGRTVVFSIEGPAGHGASVDVRATTDSAGNVATQVHWPAVCGQLLDNATYTVVARTAEPPTLTTPQGACAPYETEVSFSVIPGLPQSIRFEDAVLGVESCGNQATTRYEILDACIRLVRDQDLKDNEVELRTNPQGFGAVAPPVLGQAQGAANFITYTSLTAVYGAIPRDAAVPPHPFLGSVDGFRGNTPAGSVGLRVSPRPARLVGLTRTIAQTECQDCPTPATALTDTFGVQDVCGNPLWSLAGTGNEVQASFVPQSNPDLGQISSPRNRAAFSRDPIAIVDHDGIPGEFAIQYQPPTCTVGGQRFKPEVHLAPSWDASQEQSISIDLRPCTGCSVQVLDGTGVNTTRLNQQCDGSGEILVTQCVPAGTTAELVIEREQGSLGEPSFDRNGPADRVTATFNAASAGQIARIPFFIGTAQASDAFRVTTYIPSQAAAQTTGGVSCSSERITVDTRCSEVLISPVADNPGAVPSNPAAQDTPLCTAEGSRVFFRIKDCDQNRRNDAWDDIQNTAGTSRGLVVEVIDQDGTVFDREHPDLLEVDVHGVRSADSPYFQGTLLVTQTPLDREDSGFLKAPIGRIATLRARYVDPDDPTDNLSVAEALLVPPVPVCLPFPLQSFGDLQGEVLVHNGDAGVAGNLTLPGLVLEAKSQGAPLATSSAVDRFFNAYVGGKISVAGSEIKPSKPVDQPFTPGGSGQAFSESFPNYFQNVPDVSGLLTRLDYDRLKMIARARKVYWVAEAGTGMIVNPSRIDPGTQSFYKASFQEVTNLPGPGLQSETHDGQFIFVDAPAPGGQENTGGSIDQADLASLPVFHVAGDYYTEGLIYVAGSVVFDSRSGAKPADMNAPGVADARYDEASARFTRQDLPIDFAPGGGVPAGSADVNLRGALYCDGEVRMPGGPSVYGGVSAERGIRDARGAQIWYDPRWMESQIEICSNCCGLSLAPTGPKIALGQTVQLTANRPQGGVSWQTLAPQVADVDPTGLAIPKAIGIAVVRAVDAAGCVAETGVEVFCSLELEALGGTDLSPGRKTIVAGTGQQGTISWQVDNPTSLAITQNLGPTVEVTAQGVGGARLTASDTVGCTAWVDFTINCPTGRQLAAAPLNPEVGEQVALTVLEGTADVSGQYKFFVDGAAIAGRFFTAPDEDVLQAEGKLLDGSCRLGPIQLTVRR